MSEVQNKKNNKKMYNVILVLLGCLSIGGVALSNLSLLVKVISGFAVYFVWSILILIINNPKEKIKNRELGKKEQTILWLVMLLGASFIGGFLNYCLEQQNLTVQILIFFLEVFPIFLGIIGSSAFENKSVFLRWIAFLVGLILLCSGYWLIRYNDLLQVLIYFSIAYWWGSKLSGVFTKKFNKLEQ